mmetsp:Transcript_9796/g.18763  ORF Transcript_9796/g.18763 Transcript_9796/m.18763 type:complete len:477 (-) Transcript_9796:758-2188(-)
MRSSPSPSLSPPPRLRGVRRNRSEELRLVEQRRARYVPRVSVLLGLGILVRFLLVTPSSTSLGLMMAVGVPSLPPNGDGGIMDTVIGQEKEANGNSATIRIKAPPNTTVTTAKTKTTSTKTATNTSSSSSCPHIHLKKSTKVYKEQFLKDFPVQVPTTIPKDWDSIPCSDIPDTCDLTNTTFGHPFLMISFGRSGTTSTWDILAGLTGDYIPRATEDMGRDKKESVAFFQARNQTEHGKCWLGRLLCQKQAQNIRAYHKGYGLASVYGSKWKPWHLGLNTTQARQALEWLGTQKHIKVVYNTRNMIDMFISMRKHTFLQKLFGNERTAHCYDDREMQLSAEAWDKLAAMGIPRDTPCVQIFKQIEQKTHLSVTWMMDYFERNVLQTDFAAQMLEYYRVDHVMVTYEKLYFRETAEEWQRIFRYLGFGPQGKNLTLEEVFAKTTFQKTSSHDRSKRMANYDEVSNALRCTRYAEYLD